MALNKGAHPDSVLVAYMLAVQARGEGLSGKSVDQRLGSGYSALTWQPGFCHLILKVSSHL